MHSISTATAPTATIMPFAGSPTIVRGSRTAAPESSDPRVAAPTDRATPTASVSPATATSPTTSEFADRDLLSGDFMARAQWAAAHVGGWLLLAGSALVTGMTTLSYLQGAHPTPDARPIDYLLCIPTLILGLVLLTMRRPVPRRLLNTTPALSVMLICVPSSIDHQPTPFGAVLLTWPIVFATAVLSRRTAIATLAMAAAAYGYISLASQGFDGIVLWLEVTGAISGVGLMVLRLRRQSDRLQAAITRLAGTDPLTGLANRRSFQDALDTEHSRRQRTGRPISLLALDIDHFKRVNDTWGHAAGDAALRSLADLLAIHVRTADTIGRIGGEEFAIVLPDCASDHARHRAQALCTAIRRESSAWEHPITVSIGVTTSRTSDETPDALLRTADAALYQAKETGRNRIVVH